MRRLPQPCGVFRGAKTSLEQGTLYYHVNDPTGTTQTMTDASGALVGSVVYDALGGVLQNTIPAELTSAYAELPDAASGLVHVGGGRWYDPVIGRPLQPNPAGGAPTAPQTISRYTATSFGQPGVYQADSSSFNPFTNDYTSNTGKAFAGLLVGKGFESYATASLQTTTEMVWITIYKRVPKWAFADDALTASYTATSFLKRGLGRELFRRGIEFNSRIIEEEVQVAIETTAHHFPAGRLLEKSIASQFKINAWGNVLKIGSKLDLGIGLGLDIGYQVLLDISNPYLSPNQIFNRAVWGQGSGSLVSFTLGGLAGSAFGGPVGFVVGVGVSILWDKYAAPLIYKRLDAIPIRQLEQFAANQ